MTAEIVGHYRWVDDVLFAPSGTAICEVTSLMASSTWQLTWPDGATEIFEKAGDADAAIKRELAGHLA